MKNWTVSFPSLMNYGKQNVHHLNLGIPKLTRGIRTTFFVAFLLIAISEGGIAQSGSKTNITSHHQLRSIQEQLLLDRLAARGDSYTVDQDQNTVPDSVSNSEEYPAPKKVLYRSMMIPGWGQITNKQTWKVPIIYGLLGGLIGYSVYLNKKYHDYRAAYYNQVYSDQEGGSDFKFGTTPDYIPEGADLSSLRYNRNYYRNQRDFMYIATGLAYGLNVVDAYIFAHMRSFDVSDDLTATANVQPGSYSGGISMTITVSFTSK